MKETTKRRGSYHAPPSQFLHALIVQFEMDRPLSSSTRASTNACASAGPSDRIVASLRGSRPNPRAGGDQVEVEVDEVGARDRGDQYLSACTVSTCGACPWVLGDKGEDLAPDTGEAADTSRRNLWAATREWAGN